MDKTRELFAKNISTLRESLGLNQDEVADRLGVNSRTYQKYEYGHAYPRPDKVTKLAEIFGVSRAQLVSGETQGSPTNDRASRVLALQNKLLTMSEDDFETVEMTANNLVEMATGSMTQMKTK